LDRVRATPVYTRCEWNAIVYWSQIASGFDFDSLEGRRITIEKETNSTIFGFSSGYAKDEARFSVPVLGIVLENTPSSSQ
jgi:hypothetical protein